MSTPLPVAFDESAIGQSLDLTVGDSTLQTSASVDAHRCARSLFGQSSAQSVVEFYCYSPNLAAGLIAAAPSIVSTGSPLVPPICVGFGTVNMALNKYVGEDANAWGYCPGDGKVYNNGAAVATWTTSPLSSYVTITFDFVALTSTFASNGNVLGTITLTAITLTSGKVLVVDRGGILLICLNY